MYMCVYHAIDLLISNYFYNLLYLFINKEIFGDI